MLKVSWAVLKMSRSYTESEGPVACHSNVSSIFLKQKDIFRKGVGGIERERDTMERNG